MPPVLVHPVIPSTEMAETGRCEFRFLCVENKAGSITTHTMARLKVYSEFEASLVYKVSSRTARAIQRNPVSKNQKPTNQPNNPKTKPNQNKQRK